MCGQSPCRGILVQMINLIFITYNVQVYCIGSLYNSSLSNLSAELDERRSEQAPLRARMWPNENESPPPRSNLAVFSDSSRAGSRKVSPRMLYSDSVRSAGAQWVCFLQGS